MGIYMKMRVEQVRIVSNPTSPKCVDISVPVPKWLKTLLTQCRSVRRHFGTDAELVRTLLTQNAGTEMVWYRSVMIPKCPVTKSPIALWNQNSTNHNLKSHFWQVRDTVKMSLDLWASTKRRRRRRKSAVKYLASVVRHQNFFRVGRRNYFGWR